MSIIITMNPYLFTFLILLTAYLLVGIGYTIAAWSEAAEKEVNEGKEYTPFFKGPFIQLTVFWFVWTLYDYKANIKKTMKPIDFESLGK